MSGNLVALLYLVAGVLFILALRGLASPESSRRGTLFGMTGMAIVRDIVKGERNPEKLASSFAAAAPLVDRADRARFPRSVAGTAPQTGGVRCPRPLQKLRISSKPSR